MSSNIPCTLLAELVTAFSSLYCHKQFQGQWQMAIDYGVIVRYSPKCNFEIYSCRQKSAFSNGTASAETLE